MNENGKAKWWRHDLSARRRRVPMTLCWSGAAGVITASRRRGWMEVTLLGKDQAAAALRNWRSDQVTHLPCYDTNLLAG
eukprot:CAMPEP_0202005338 /NCGR_PEP_ID=MMETSP0905-20130828/10403_1 /ASSEMBLY_ACC=CAM_ASM_000554 /TAXON_ID=420261 /ORGANISM="Thalassiosira antarctica, Strain CCMP982" /LENGTH=78 /DNA_ID=CAMNT_0048562883 /DNA_START=469 /DNA_END=701 /DNA_ORIENTATION=+